MSSMPNVPQIPALTFRECNTIQSIPSVDDYRGKSVVLGSSNSAHDICAALWEQDATSP
jgi:putative flavoprotein involved in K+ transport